MRALSSWLGGSVYFVLIDRFQNGDKSRDDFGRGEYSPTDDDCFQGGDLAGLIEKLPHIKKLGFSALWLTPPVHNQWINPYIKTRGYHGYWAYDFTKIDPHFGTLDDYKRLVAKAHALGLKVVQDIVVNHTGNYFTVAEKDFDPARPELNWRECDGAYPPEGRPKAPNDPVFRMNNPNDAQHKAAAVYNFTPNISDFRDRTQTLNWSMGDLDDINLRSPLAARRLKEIYRYWVEQAGVDGFRVDTVYYTPEEFYDGFLYDRDPRSPGIKTFARKRGKTDFFVFGEVWSYDYGAIGRYLAKGRKRRLDSAIDLPLNEALTQVFYRKAATRALKAPLLARRQRRALWVNFLDNHDVERMSARAGRAAVEQSLVALFTLPGVPCVYYGTEAALTQTRQNMFEERHFDEKSRPYLFLKDLVQFRRRRPALAQGTLSVERASLSCGPLAYSVRKGRQVHRVVFNTSDNEAVFDFGADALTLEKSSHRLKPSGVRVLPPESWFVLKRAAAGKAAKPRLVLRPLAGDQAGRVELRYELRGPAPSALWVLVDDDYSRRLPVEKPFSGRFQADASALGNGLRGLRLLAQDKSGLSLSNEIRARVANPYRALADAAALDAHAHLLSGVHAPGDPSYGGQLCLERARVLTSGRDLRLQLEMKDVTRSWNPPHGYDHVYFSVFFDFPGKSGANFLPKLGYCPPGFEFNAGFLLYGWGMRSFGPAGSTPDAYGPPLAGEVEQAADPAGKTVTFTFSDKLFRSLQGFSGVKLFISTWDGYLGEFRSIAGSPEDWSFYTRGGASTALPKIYDQLTIAL